LIENLRTFLDRLVIVIGLGMVLGISLDPNFRYQVADIIGFIFRPITVLPIHWAILVLALITAIITSVIQKIKMDNEEMQEAQSKMKDLQERMKEARVENNDQELEELQAQQKEMMGEFVGVQKQMFKPMFYIMALTIPIFSWIYMITTDPAHTHLFDQNGADPVGILVPFFGTVKFTETVAVIPGGIFWYIICSLPLSQLVRKILNVRMGAS